jgi:hypothetical protein
MVGHGCTDADSHYAQGSLKSECLCTISVRRSRPCTLRGRRCRLRCSCQRRKRDYSMPTCRGRGRYSLDVRRYGLDGLAVEKEPGGLCS